MRRDLELEATIVAKYTAVAPVLDERIGGAGRRRSRWRLGMEATRWSRRRRVWLERPSGRDAERLRGVTNRRVGFGLLARDGPGLSSSSPGFWKPSKRWCTR